MIGCIVCSALAAAAAVGGQGRAAGRRVVDVHAHIQVAAYLAAAAEAGLARPAFGKGAAGPAGAGSPAGDDEAGLAIRLQMMDAAGVATQVLSPTLAPYLAQEEPGARITRLLNDRHAEIARAHPGRLASFVSLPLPHVEASLKEMRRGLDELGMAGVTMQCSALGVSAADARFEPLFKEMNDRKAVLFLHPAVTGLASPMLNDWSLTAAAGPLMEDATVAMQLIVRGIPVRYPNIQIIVPHLGGGLSLMLERLDNQLPIFVPGLAGRPSELARRFWYDTVSHGSRPALHSAVQAFGADRLLPGSDFPVLLTFEAYAKTIGYVAEAGLSRADAEQILHGNARRLFAFSGGPAYG